MTTVFTEFGEGRIVDSDTVRGRTQYKVAGYGFEVWLDETEVNKRTAAGPVFDFEPSTHTWDNSTTLPYDWSPQYPVDMFRHEQTISPDHKIDPKKRLHPSDSKSGEDREPTHEYPGPNPDLFAKREAAWNDPTPGYELPEHARAKRGEPSAQDVVNSHALRGQHDDHRRLLDPEHGKLAGVDDDLESAWHDEVDTVDEYLDYEHEADEEGYPEVADLFSEIIDDELEHADLLSEVDSPVNLSDKFIEIPDELDHYGDPAQRFTDDPLREIQQQGELCLSLGVDPEVEEEGLLAEADKQIRTAAWKDVRQKAMRLKREGRVHVKANLANAIYAHVDGDNGEYSCMILKGGSYGKGSQTIDSWSCDCDWGRWAFKRKYSYVGRLCFLPGTPVVMADGTLKPIEDVIEGDLVRSHTGEARKVNATILNHHNDLVYGVHPRGHETIWATGNHPFYVRPHTDIKCQDCWDSNRQRSYCTEGTSLWKSLHQQGFNPQWVEAANLTENYWISKTAPKIAERTVVFDLTEFCDRYHENGEGRIRRGTPLGTELLLPMQVQEIRQRYAAGGVTQQQLADEYLPGKNAQAIISRVVRGEYGIRYRGTPVDRYVKLDEDLAYLFGLYLGDGSHPRSGTVGFHFGLGEQHLVDEVVRIAGEKFGLVPQVHVQRSGRNIIDVFLTSAVVTEFFHRYIGTGHAVKKLASEILEAPASVLSHALRGWIDSDDASSVNRNLVFQMEQIALRNGISCSVTTTPAASQGNEMVGFNTKDIYHLNCSPKLDQKSQFFTNFVEGDTAWVRIQGVEQRYYHGPVFNLSVEGEESYQVNGINTHNCSHGYATYLMMQSDAMKKNPGKFRPKRVSSIVDDFKKWVKDENGNHIDQDAANAFLSNVEEPATKEDATKVFDYVDTNHSEHPERNYEVDEYTCDPSKVWEGGEGSADILRHQPGKTSPHLYVVPEGEGEWFTDLGDDRKTTGPGQIVAKTANEHHPDFAWHEKSKEDFPKDGIVHFSSLTFTAEDNLIQQLRDLSAEKPGENNQRMQDHNREVTEVVQELRDRGYAAEPLVAMKRQAMWKTADDDDPTSHGAPLDIAPLDTGGAVPGAVSQPPPTGAFDPANLPAGVRPPAAPAPVGGGDNGAPGPGPSQGGAGVQPGGGWVPSQETTNITQGGDYTVKPGDTASAIADRAGVPVSSLGLDNPDVIMPGQKINVGTSPTPDAPPHSSAPASSGSTGTSAPPSPPAAPAPAPGGSSGAPAAHTTSDTSAAPPATTGFGSSALGQTLKGIVPPSSALGQAMGGGGGHAAPAPTPAGHSSSGGGASGGESALGHALKGIVPSSSALGHLFSSKSAQHFATRYFLADDDDDTPHKGVDPTPGPGNANKGSDYLQLTSPNTPVNAPRPTGTGQATSGPIGGAEGQKTENELAMAPGPSNTAPNKKEEAPAASPAGGGAGAMGGMQALTSVLPYASQALSMIPGIGPLASGLVSGLTGLGGGLGGLMPHLGSTDAERYASLYMHSAADPEDLDLWNEYPFAGSGANPQEWSSTSEDYVEQHEHANRKETWHTDHNGDIIKHADMLSGDAGYGGGPGPEVGGATLSPSASGMGMGGGNITEPVSPDTAPSMGTLTNTASLSDSARSFWADVHTAEDVHDETGYFNPDNPHASEDEKGGEKKKSPGGPSIPGGGAKAEAAEAAGEGGIAAEAGGAASKLLAVASNDDIVRQFQASMAGQDFLSKSASNGAFNENDIAAQAQKLLKTAGRTYTPAEQRSLEDERHPLGARNLRDLDLSGTHYEEF